MNLIACMKRMGSCFKRTHYKKAFQIYFHVTVPNIKLSITMIIIIMIMIVFNILIIYCTKCFIDDE